MGTVWWYMKEPGELGIKVCREAERKEKGDPMQIS